MSEALNLNYAKNSLDVKLAIDKWDLEGTNTEMKYNVLAFVNHKIKGHRSSFCLKDYSDLLLNSKKKDVILIGTKNALKYGNLSSVSKGIPTFENFLKGLEDENLKGFKVEKYTTIGESVVYFLVNRSDEKQPIYVAVGQWRMLFSNNENAAALVDEILNSKEFFAKS